MAQPTSLSAAAEREALLEKALGEVRAIERKNGVTRDALEQIKGVMLDVAARKELFDEVAFPPPTSEKPNVIYLLNEDADRRFALYLSCGMPGKATPPHDHTTWAVIVGLGGQEENRIYRRVDDGSVRGRGEVEEVRRVMLSEGVGIAYMPDDIHSIHALGAQPTRHFHLYGRSLEDLPGRVAYDTEAGTCTVFPASPHITRGRPGAWS